MKMTYDEFLKRQKEFEGHRVMFKVKSNLPMDKGRIKYFERTVNDGFCKSDGKNFKILEVEILEYIGITTLKINDNGAFGLKTE